LYLCGMRSKAMAPKGRALLAIQAQNLLEAALSERTLKEYRRWIGEYQKWCAASGLDPFALTTVGAWIEHLATKYRMATIEHASAAVRFLWKLKGLDNPLHAEPLRLLMRALRRRLGTAKRQVRPLLPSQLACMRWDAGTKGVRDRALLLVGFGAALRVSELCALTIDDIELTPEGVIITVRRSKTDQTGHGRQVAIPRSAGTLCPVRALEDYLAIRGWGRGPLFQSMHKDKLTGRPLDQRNVRDLIKDYADRMGLDPAQFSTHSMRAGFATAAALAGADMEVIASQTGHRSMEVLRGYIRRANLFQRNAASWVFRN